MVDVIGWDLRGVIGNKHGFGRYGYELLKAFVEIQDRVNVVAFVDRDPEIDRNGFYGSALDHLPADRVSIVHLARDWTKDSKFYSRKTQWEQQDVPRELAKRGIKLYYSPITSVPIKNQYWDGVRVIQFHDATPFIRPEWYTRQQVDCIKDMFPKSIAVSKYIFCDSEYTKKTMITCFPGVDKDKVIGVITGGVSSFCVGDQVPVEQDVLWKRINDLLPDRFILSVGTIQPRKNYLFLLRLVERLNRKDIGLIIIGANGWDQGYNVQVSKKCKLLRDLGVPVCAFGYLHDVLLRQLYAKAGLMVLSSYSEGFGLPVVEAVANWCPVLVPAHSSFLDFNLPSHFYYKYGDGCKITRKMQSLIDGQVGYDPKWQKEFVSRFQWSAGAEKLYSVVQREVCQG